jgi:hypothetical protein
VEAAVLPQRDRQAVDRLAERVRDEADLPVLAGAEDAEEAQHGEAAVARAAARDLVLRGAGRVRGGVGVELRLRDAVDRPRGVVLNARAQHHEASVAAALRERVEHPQVALGQVRDRRRVAVARRRRPVNDRVDRVRAQERPHGARVQQVELPLAAPCASA